MADASGAPIPNGQSEGNKVADALAKTNQGFDHFESQWWDEAPLFILPILHSNSIGLPYFRNVSSNSLHVVQTSLAFILFLVLSNKKY